MPIQDSIYSQGERGRDILGVHGPNLADLDQNNRLGSLGNRGEIEGLPGARRRGPRSSQRKPNYQGYREGGRPTARSHASCADGQGQSQPTLDLAIRLPIIREFLDLLLHVLERFTGELEQEGVLARNRDTYLTIEVSKLDAAWG